MTQIYPPRSLDAAGHCCGRATVRLHQDRKVRLCPFCATSYDETGSQIENWAWTPRHGGFVAVFPDTEYAKRAAA